MKIYRSSFIPENTIYRLSGNVVKDIRESYTGGAVDVYIPSYFNERTRTYQKVYSYDAVSLDATIMATMGMPVGKPVAFEGDITEFEPEFCGFAYCDITAPDNLEHPILQKRVRTKDGIRTVTGLGYGASWVTSTSLFKGAQLGYKFKIIRGYKFKEEVIFKEFVEAMFELRSEYPKSHPLNYIAKLLNNSLDGK